MEALILAAGDGDRLRPLTMRTPKPLLPLLGRPILAHVFDALADAGVSAATIVSGYRAPALRAGVEAMQPPIPVRFAHNASWPLGNARSLWAARHVMTGPFVLAMADHLFDPAIARTLMLRPPARCALAIDRCAASDPRAGEATRALVRDGRVVALGKTLEEWNALDTGLFLCTADIFARLTPANRDGELGAIFAMLARDGELDAVDVTGEAWVDIDTVDDLRTAEALLTTLQARGAVA